MEQCMINGLQPLGSSAFHSGLPTCSSSAVPRGAGVEQKEELLLPAGSGFLLAAGLGWLVQLVHAHGWFDLICLRGCTGWQCLVLLEDVFNTLEARGLSIVL